jgi:hypothetical protein
MPKYIVEQQVNYYAEIEANSEDEAFRLYLKDQDTYYESVEDQRIELQEEDDDE